MFVHILIKEDILQINDNFIKTGKGQTSNWSSLDLAYWKIS